MYGGDATSVSVNLVAGMTYYWKVVVSDGTDTGVSDIWNFTTVSE